jgi:uncharacterized membrane-anchored protein
MVRDIFRKTFSLLTKPEKEWTQILNNKKELKQEISESYIPVIGIATAIYFLSNLFQEKTLEINLKEISLVFICLYFTLYIINFLFTKSYSKRLRIEESKFGVYLINSISIYILILGISKLLPPNIAIYVEILGSLSYLVGFWGSKTYLEIKNNLQAVIIPIFSVTLYIIIFKSLYLTMMYLLNNYSIDVFKL